MTSLSEILLYTFLAGACIPVGALLAMAENLRPGWLENELRHSIIAFGGGILLAAVALVLVPEGEEYLHHSPLSTLILIAGGLAFFALESWMGRKKREKPQLIAMLLDYMPESVALGGAFALGASSAPLLAVLIGLQNLPEGFNAFRELDDKQPGQRRKLITFMAMLSLIGPVLAWIGWAWLTQYTQLLGCIMLFASGGILYLIFQDIAPQAHIRKHWAPPLGAVLGFAFAMIGNQLLC